MHRSSQGRCTTCNTERRTAKDGVERGGALEEEGGRDEGAEDRADCRMILLCTIC